MTLKEIDTLCTAAGGAEGDARGLIVHGLLELSLSSAWEKYEELSRSTRNFYLLLQMEAARYAPALYMSSTPVSIASALRTAYIERRVPQGGTIPSPRPLTEILLLNIRDTPRLGGARS